MAVCGGAMSLEATGAGEYLYAIYIYIYMLIYIYIYSFLSSFLQQGGYEDEGLLTSIKV